METIVRDSTTAQVRKLRAKYIDDVVCEMIGISKPTFYKRLKDHNWSKSQRVLIAILN